VAIKDLFRRLTGKDDGSKRGRRAGRSIERRRDDATVQIASPVAQAPRPPAPAASPQPYSPPPTPGPAPVAPPPVAPQPAAAPARPRERLQDAPTQYNVIPKLGGPVAGVLVGVDGELMGEVYKIRSGENKLGRSESCDVVLPSVKISREHATIFHEEGIFGIAPLSEKNATFVNDEPVEACELHDGDVIRLGSSTFRFRTIEGL